MNVIGRSRQIQGRKGVGGTPTGCNRGRAIQRWRNRAAPMAVRGAWSSPLLGDQECNLIGKLSVTNLFSNTIAASDLAEPPCKSQTVFWLIREARAAEKQEDHQGGLSADENLGASERRAIVQCKEQMVFERTQTLLGLPLPWLMLRASETRLCNTFFNSVISIF